MWVVSGGRVRQLIASSFTRSTRTGLEWKGVSLLITLKSPSGSGTDNAPMRPFIRTALRPCPGMPPQPERSTPPRRQSASSTRSETCIVVRGARGRCFLESLVMYIKMRTMVFNHFVFSKISCLPLNSKLSPRSKFKIITRICSRPHE
jgi:hypothetical protein